MLAPQMDDRIHDLVIAGAGPVGATAANLAGEAGLDTLVVDPSDDVFPLPRAIHFDAEVMRIFQAAGIADRVLPLTRASTGSVHVGADGEPIREFRVGDALGDLGWRPHYMFFQPELDALLRTSAAERPTVTLETGWACTAVDDRGDHVAATLTAPDGAERTVRGRYLLACDGASSPVRKHLGLRLFDYGFDEPWIIIDTFVPSEDLGPEHMTMYCDPRRPGTYVPGPRRHRRWEFMLLPGETGEELRTPEGARRLIGPKTPWLADIADAEIVRSAVYRFHALVSEQWASGRVLLAGDAVHQTPPFYGQGMCHGIRDVHNLIWKLVHVRDGRLSEHVLETYQAERAPHVRAIIEAAVENGRYICTLDTAVAAERDRRLRERMRAGLDVGSFRDVIPPLEDGLIDYGTLAGTLLPQPEPGLDDELGDGFALVTTTAPPAGKAIDWFTGPLRGRIVDRPVPEMGGWLRAKDVVAVVVRPDRYVYGSARTTGDIGGLVDRLRESAANPVPARGTPGLQLDGAAVHDDAMACGEEILDER